MTDEEREEAINAKAEELTAEMQRLAIKYDDFDDVAVLRNMQEKGIPTLALSYRDLTNNLDLEDGIRERFNRGSHEKITRVSKDDVGRLLSEALNPNREEVAVNEEAFEDRLRIRLNK